MFTLRMLKQYGKFGTLFGFETKGTWTKLLALTWQHSSCSHHHLLHSSPWQQIMNAG